MTRPINVSSSMTISNFSPRLCLSAVALVLSLGLASCSKQDTPAAPTTAAAVAPAQSYDALAKDGKGFTAGAMMSTQTAYVLFDPQCPHCGALWKASLPLQKKVKFVWIPVSLMNPNSTLQGAALLTAANPVEMMTAHETGLMAGNGGMIADANPSAEAQATIKANTLLFNSLGATSVPYIVAKNASTGAVVTNSGALQTPALAAFLGVE
jgi:thiol:disulfide interchange protein DsbG